MNKLTVSVELANQILSYLGNRPYHEVFQLVEMLQKEAKESMTNAEQTTDSTAS